MDDWILETERLRLRKLTQADFENLCGILQDAQAMYAYEHAFSDQEVQAWLDNQLRRYQEEEFGLWAVIRRQDGAFVGQCGLTWQDWDGRRVPEVGYLFRRDCWHNGYATEAARAVRDWAFAAYDFPAVYSIIRDINTASQRVAARNGMRPVGKFTKHYYGMDMPHLVYQISREDASKQAE